MHIAFLNPSAQLGGAERVLLDLLHGLRVSRREWTLTLVAPSEGRLTAHARQYGAGVVVVPFAAALAAAGDYGGGPLRVVPALPAAMAYVGALRRALSGLGADIIHTNGSKMHLAAGWAKPADTPLVWHLHDYVSRRRLTTTLMRRFAGRCAAIVANSHSVAEDARSALALPAGAVHAIPNGIDLDVFTTDGDLADLDSLAGVAPASDSVVRVGMVATYALWKGHRTFLEAIARLNEPSIRAFIVGGPIYDTARSQHTRAGLEAMANELGIRARVAFIDFVENPAAVFRALDIVVHASTEREPFGLAIAEAMACGRAVVAAGAGGATEVLQADVDGLMHCPGDAAGLASAITRLAADPTLRARLGRQARCSAEQRLNKHHFVERFSELFDTIGSRVPIGAAAELRT